MDGCTNVNKDMVKALIKSSIMDNSIKKELALSTNSLSENSVDEDGGK